MKNNIAFTMSVSAWILLASCASFMSKGPNDWGNIDADSIAMAVQGMDTSAAARVLFDIGERRFKRSPLRMVEKRHVRIQILKESGKEYANIKIPFYKKEVVARIDAQTILPKGDVIKLKNRDIFEEGEKDGWRYKVFSIPGVQKKSVIEYKYVKETQYLGVVDPWVFQRDIETALSRVTVIVPPGFNYTSIIKNMPEDKYTLTKETLLNPNRYKEAKFTWEATNLPPIKNEPYMTTINDYLGRLHFQLQYYKDSYNYIKFIQSWDDVVDNILENYTLYLRGDRDVSELAQRIIRDEVARDRKIQVIYEFIRDSIETGEYKGFTGYNFLNPDKIIETRIASAPEKNLLLVMMLQSLNIPTTPVAISTRSHGRVNQQIPRIASFNHILAYTKGYQGEYFLDTKDPQCPFTMLPPEDNVGTGLVLQEERARFIKIPAPKSVNMKYVGIEQATLDSVGTLRFKSVLRFEGYRNIYYRRYLSRAKDQETFVEKSIVDNIQNVKVDTFSLENIDTKEAPLIVNLQCTVSDFAMVAGDKMYFPTTVFHKMKKNIFQYENRTYPVEYNYLRKNHEQIKILLPAAYTVTECPQTKVISINGHVYKKKIKEENHQITCTRELLINKTFIMPQEYQIIRGFYSDVVQNDQSQVILSAQ